MNENFQSMISIVEPITPDDYDPVQNQAVNNAQKLIKPPFPPMIDPCDLIVLRPDGHVPRTPNAFIIYRKLFVKAASIYKHNLPMSIISSIASKSWEQEPDDVKGEYKRIAKEAFNYRNKLFPGLKSVSRRNRWRTILFNKPYIRKIRIPKSRKSINNKHTKPKQPKSPITSTSKLEIGGLNEISSPTLNLYVDWTNQDIPIVSSPNLSAQQQLNLSRIDNNIACDNHLFVDEFGASAFPEDNLFEIFDFQNTISLDRL
ncbi:3311_t:CDS:2 [Cetraspora pellucida]|uniref:3311_t:CDS:1 n=1 Tax=Cetraspora pellucida TaxID=1433469 RepID=A0A9N9HYH1_9GLOM|nr:3311_t:CDS:2 [Cetraspora pellucida]